MNDTRSNRFTPVTVGMAIALFMLALVVDKANAWSSVCNQCIAVADRDAKKYCGDPNSSTYYQCYMGPDGFSKFKKERCEDTKICPDATEVGSKDCNSDACRFGDIPREICKNDGDAGAICHNDCFQMGCGTKSEGKGCYDIKANKWEEVAKNVQPTPCMIKCGCAMSGQY